ncbi:olfactory receptor 10AG1-like [Sarcophilus harrisii]|uniref:olfactory receptor 10AG1-like n=1 Tax=Sarcophilus harrisii TaxID=9305 RepID=UPI000273C378|nr:olfactory receptor 10AG1-like [Sarcophilus harrisii]
MAGGNITDVKEFILLGFSDIPKFQGLLFGIFLIIYLCIIIGNTLIIIITKADPALQTPMYYFLGNFSFLEICYTSVTLPRMLMNLWTQKRNISLLACATQVCLILGLGGSECFLLAAMAYDRYVAICKPLYYLFIMNHKICVQLLIGSWIIGIPVVLGQTYQIFSLPFCGPTRLNHIFCDIYPILQVACGDTSMSEILIYLDVGLFGIVPFLLICGSYIKIIVAILKLPSAIGKSKAFSTCSSHLMVVGLFFGSGIIVYLQPKSSHSAGSDKILSLFYTTLTPLCNPMIYSLRNKDFIVTIRKLLSKCSRIGDR